MHIRSWSWGRTALAVATVGAITALVCAVSPDDRATATAIAGSATVGLLLIRRWLAGLEAQLTDTTEERRRLAEQTAQSHASHMANIAARDRLRTAAAEAETRNAQLLANSIATMRSSFENTRAQDLCEAYELGAMNERNGVHKKPAAATGSLIYLADRRRPTEQQEAGEAKLP